MATNNLDGLTTLLQGLSLGEIPEFASADVLHRPVDIFHVYLADTLQKLLSCDPQQAYDAIQPANNTTNGDLDIVLPRLKLPDSPDLEKLAEDLVAKFPAPHPLFAVPWKDSIHIRVFFSPRVLPRIVLPYILDRGVQYGCSIDPASRVLPSGAAADTTAHNSSTSPDGPTLNRALVEFSSPNLGPDFRADHLRSTVLGAFVANIYKAMGWNVLRVNYLGDWGMHIGLLSMGWKRWGQMEKLNEHPEPFRYLHDLYTRMDEELKPAMEAKRKARDKNDTASDGGAGEDGLFAERDAAFKKLEEGDHEAVELWDRLRRISIDYYTSEYSHLGVTFEDYSGESRVCHHSEVIESIDAQLREKKISEQADDGSWVLDFGKHGAARLGSATVRGKHGTSTYFLRDVATVFDRLGQYHFAKMIYVVGEQDLHFRQVFKAVELLGSADVAARLQHLTFTRGPARWGDERLLGGILGVCEEYSQRGIEEPTSPLTQLGNLDPSVRKTIAINSLKLSELSTRNRTPSTGLDAQQFIASEGKTGMSLEAGYRRLETCINKLREEATAAAGGSAEGWPEPDYLSLANSPWIDLIRLLLRFPAIMATAYKTLEPQGLVEYLFNVLDEVGYCLEETDEGLVGIDGDGEAVAAKRQARIMLFRSALQVVKNSMQILNIGWH